MNTSTQLKVVSNTRADHNQETIIRAQLAKSKGIEFSIREFLDDLDIDFLTTNQKKQLAELCEIPVSKVNSALASHANEKVIIAVLGKKPGNEYEFVELQLAQWQTQMTYNEIYTVDTPYLLVVSGNPSSTIVDQATLTTLSESEQIAIKAADPKRLTLDGIFKKLILANVQLNLGYTERQIELGLEAWTQNAKNLIVAGAILKINPESYDEARAANEWDTFIGVTAQDHLQECIAVLKHFIWQVKRKIVNDHNYPVLYHMMIVLYGAQGLGKSTWIKLFISVLADFAASTDFKMITDERNHDLWSKFILILDEMADSTRTNIEDIKRKITESSFSGRKMRSNNATQIINRSTFIGASNKDISRLIIDDTGMRRFFQINYRAPTNNEWEILNNIDYTLLWNSVDYRADSPLQTIPELFDSIKSIQNSKRHVGLVEQFLMDRTYQHHERIPAVDLYKEFQAFELTQRPRNEQTNTAFGKELMDVYKRIPGLSIDKWRSNRGNGYEIINDNVSTVTSPNHYQPMFGGSEEDDD
jgi:hypothetical protein